VSFYEEPDEMFDNEQLDGVMIGTRCSLHTKMAVKVLERNIPLFLEKPVATTMKDYSILKDAAEKTKSQVVVSFPLRTSAICVAAKEIIDSGKIGTVENVQAINNVPYGRVYYHHWYRDEEETQGLFLQKATHDFDYINYLIDIKPVEICAITSKQIFKGEKLAGLKCKDCDEYYTCNESPYVIKHMYSDNPIGEMCCYAVDTGNEDSGSALIRYETGMHVSYSQNFFARHKAGARGARLFGYKGTLEFDWYTGEIKVFMHQTPRVDTYKFDSTGSSHFGGDDVLAHNFINVMKGKEQSIAPIEAGLISSLMCIKARQSAMTSQFKKIED
jgi:predicted dehydrogenase